MKGIDRSLGAIVIAVSCVFVIQAQQPLSSNEKKLFSEFEQRAKKYVELRNSAAKGIPKVSKDATPAEITANKLALQAAVQNANSGVRQGFIFTPDAVVLIRKIIKNEFKGYERVELRKSVLEADTKGVPLKVNFPYPESKELVEMSPSLLLSLPQLPKELRYRYIGRSLVILDRDDALIVDYFKEALP